MAPLLLLMAAVAYAQLPPQQRVTGRLSITWGDPRQNSGDPSETIYWLENISSNGVPPELAGRNRVRLRIAGKENQAVFAFGKNVAVVGRAIANPVPAARNAEPFVFDTEEIEEPLASAISTGAAVSGTKKVIFLLLKFSDDASVPHPPSFFTNLTNPDTPPLGESFPATINGFFKKTSYNQFSWIGDVGGVGGLGAPGGWLTLPQPKSFYAPCGWSSSCANLNAIGNDGTAMGRAEGIDFKAYDNINFVLSNDLDCCAWGGTYFSNVDVKSYGATWEPPWGQEAGTYAHEMGHSLGLPHSGWVYQAYDSPWDMMSNRVAASRTNCGSYFSRNSNGNRTLLCDEPGDGYIAAHKDFLAWLPGANITQLTAGASATVTLEGLALPLGAEKKLIKICLNGFACSGGSARYFTAEARTRNQGATSQYDNGIPGEGVIIQEFQANRPSIGGTCFFNSQSGWVVPVDSTPGDFDSVSCNGGNRSFPNYGLNNAQWLPGGVYNNSNFGFAISVASRNGSTFVVNVGPAVKRRVGQLTSD
jgi:M6 family metalloprotease-like protein